MMRTTVLVQRLTLTEQKDLLTNEGAPPPPRSSEP